jgi:hypothetical protein
MSQELDLSVKVVEKNFLKDPNVLETDEFRAVNPAAKCAGLHDMLHSGRLYMTSCAHTSRRRRQQAPVSTEVLVP